MACRSHLADVAAPGGRTPPQELVALLRELNPAVELVYGGRGWWLLGSVRHDRVNHVKIGVTIRALKDSLNYVAPGGASHVDPGARPAIDLEDPEVRWELWYRLWVKKLEYQGFRLIVRFHEAELDSAIVERYRRGRWIRRNAEAAAAVEREASEIVDDETRKTGLVRDALESEHRSIHRHVFRHRKQVLTDVADYDRRVGRSVTTPAGSN